MFSFHKPKVYRSPTGCCICKAKSSSSRFTDSKKYEEDFLECFQLATPRQGEICNACVLLVKRWKKLPKGSDRNWRHVVDARAGPGMKSMTKFKSKNKKVSHVTLEESSNEKMEKIMKKKKHNFEREDSPMSDKSDNKDDVEMADAEVDFMSESVGSSRTASPGGSDCEDNVNLVSINRRHKVPAKRRNVQPEISGFVDLGFWKREIICCGTIFKGPNGEVLIDPQFFKPCSSRVAVIGNVSDHKVLHHPPHSPTISSSAAHPIEAHPNVVKTFSDSSSDSGYDESSNQGLAPAGAPPLPLPLPLPLHQIQVAN